MKGNGKLSASLSFSRSARFFARDEKLTKVSVKRFFTAWMTAIGPTSVVHQVLSRQREDLGATYSLAIFQLDVEPNFLSGSALRDTAHGFILLIETERVAAIFSKLAGSPDQYLPDELQPIGYEATLELFGGDQAAYESISLRTLGSSRGGLLRRSYQALDLNAVMPRAGARRSAPSNVKVRRDNRTRRLAPATSRVSQQGGRANLAELFAFVRLVDEELHQAQTSAFIQAFAEPIPISSIGASIKPTSLLIHWHELEDLLENADLKNVDSTGASQSVAADATAELRGILTAELTLQDAEDGSTVIVSDNTQIGSLRKLKTRISLSSPELARHFVEIDNESVPLDRVLSAKQLFTIGFSDASYSYTAGALFRNRRLPEELTSFLSSFHVLPDLPQTLSEKGEFAKDQSAFSGSSVFGVVEKHASADGAIVICDDLDDEWADHIVLNSKALEIEFIHSKWKTPPTTSASAFHDLVGQATKNLGNLTDSGPRFATKCDAKWIAKYKNDKIQTSIKRIRSQHTPKQCTTTHAALRARIATVLRMSLAAPFLSKSQLDAVAGKLAASSPVKANVVQLLWILASFIDVCRTNGVQPRVYCSP